MVFSLAVGSTVESLQTAFEITGDIYNEKQVIDIQYIFCFWLCRTRRH